MKDERGKWYKVKFNNRESFYSFLIKLYDQIHTLNTYFLHMKLPELVVSLH